MLIGGRKNEVYLIRSQSPKVGVEKNDTEMEQKSLTRSFLAVKFKEKLHEFVTQLPLCHDRSHQKDKIFHCS